MQCEIPRFFLNFSKTDNYEIQIYMATWTIFQITCIFKKMNKKFEWNICWNPQTFLKTWTFYKNTFFKLWTIFGNGKMFWTYRRNLEICLLMQILFSIFEHITKTIILICNIFKSWIIFWKTQNISTNGNNNLYSKKSGMTKNYNFKHI